MSIESGFAQPSSESVAATTDTNNLLLEQKIKLQELVMRQLGFSLPHYGPQNQRPMSRSAKALEDAASLKVFENWSQGSVGGIKELTYAAIFDYVYQKMLSNPNEMSRTGEIKPREMAHKIAEEIKNGIKNKKFIIVTVPKTGEKILYSGKIEKGNTVTARGVGEQAQYVRERWELEPNLIPEDTYSPYISGAGPLIVPDRSSGRVKKIKPNSEEMKY